MKKSFIVFILCILFAVILTGCNKVKVDQLSDPEDGETVAEIIIEDYGSIFVKFFDDAAPKAVENFVTHAKDGYYDGVIFHRIFEDFMIQGGDPTGTGKGGESIWGETFEDEFVDDLQPLRGTLCMANAGKNTNGSQFFIVQSKETFTEDEVRGYEDYIGTTYNSKAINSYEEIGGTPWLYNKHTVFGQVYEGYDVLDEVAGVSLLDEKKGIPVEEVVIDTIKIFDYVK